MILCSRNSQFYLVLDIANSTSHEIELQYTSSKCIIIEGNESCRIPVPVNRCPLSKLTKVSDINFMKIFIIKFNKSLEINNPNSL